MSLLLDARKKILGARDTASMSSAESALKNTLNSVPSTDSTDARNIGKNLFAAKSGSGEKKTTLNKNLLFALGATVLVLGGGLGYLSLMGTDNNHLTPAHRTLANSGAITPHDALPDETASPPDEPTAETHLIADIAPAHAENLSQLPKTAVPEKTRLGAEIKSSPTRRVPATTRLVQAGQTANAEMVDPLLSTAYQAYQNGDFDTAQKAYLTMLSKEPSNRDALLGLAAIAQQREDLALASHYYQHLLKIDPRDPAANAALSALTSEDGNSESRLKTLLREQPNAAPLHFALGNQYAAEARWGEAQQAYFNAHTYAPNNPEFALNLAISLDHLGQTKPALQYYQRALQLDHGHSLDRASVNLRIQELTN